MDALAFLRERLTPDSTGPGRLILVSGGVASGKTRLLDDVLDTAVREGVRALSATGAAEEQTVAGGVIDQLLSGPDAPRAAAEEAAHLIEISHGAGRGEPAGEPGTARAAPPLVWRLARVLLELARERPMVIVVDDVHLADTVSVLLLQHLQRRLRSTRLTIVLSFRDGPRTAARGMRFTRHAHHHIRLAPLSEQAVRAMLDGCDGDGLASLIHQLGAGNPLLVDSLTADCAATGDIGRAATADGVFSRALVSYLDRWDLPLREAAGAVAVFGTKAPADVVAELAGITTALAEEAIEALTGSGLMADGWFRHPAVESAVLRALPVEARRTAHLRAAEIAFRQAARPKDIAAHLIAAGAAEPRWAIPVLRRAADQAAADGEADIAERCLELALATADTSEDKRPVLAALARHTWRTRPSAGALHLDALQELPADGAAPDERAEAAAAAARRALWEGDEAAYRTNRQTVSDRADARTETALRLAHVWWFGPAGADATTRLSADDPWRLTATELSRIWSQSGNDASTAAAERLLRSCRLDDVNLEALMTAVLALVHANRTEDAETWWRSLKAEADRRGAVTWQAVLTGMWASAVLRSGGVSYAAELARHALSLLPAQDWGAAVGDPLATLLLAWTAAGEYDRAAGLLTHQVPDGMFQTLAGIRFVRARGHYHLATGHLLAAVNDFTACGRMLAARAADLPVVAPWRADLAAAHLALGNLGTARDLAAEQLALAAETDAYTRGLALRVQALAGDPGDLRRTLRQAAATFADSGDRWEAHRTSQMLDGPPQQRIAVPAPRTPVPDRVGASRNPVSAAVVSRCLSATARTEPEADGIDAISAAELRVAELAALGMTNQEISESLPITVSTVEQHLTRVYRKLRIRGRAELAARLRADHRPRP